MTPDARKILLACADDAVVRQLLPALSTLSCGSAAATTAGSFCETLATLDADPSFTAILLDLALADDCTRALADIRRSSPSAAVIVLIDAAREDSALDALRQGAQDYLVKSHIR